ncbi:DUF6817 domain-containing protein [Sphingomonas sp. PR090111-T3T-6A]|uniref:DUF6817 domain-containing protein n=1 Tax=Sphingomonas sp. PR090111-T3T-6A TaxID=685778 RepID=UPI000371A5C4|nr:hypothetical protein [Sphingomonas sp. PR090111-T3T-6A]
MPSFDPLDGPDPGEAILRYLIELPGAFASHSGTTLFHHLLGTYRLLRAWGCGETVGVVGLYHSVYGTPAFKTGPLDARSRDAVAAVIGSETEALVHAFSLLDWREALAADEPWFAAIPAELKLVAAANFVEQRERVFGRGPLPEVTMAAYRRLLPYLSPPADTQLAAALDGRMDADAA